MASFANNSTSRWGDPQLCFNDDRYVILLRKAKLNRAVQKVVPERLCHRLLHLERYPVEAGHRKELGGSTV